MDKDIELKLKDYIQKSRKKCFALRDWIQRQCKPFGVMEALECLFVASGGKVTVMDDIISQITTKEKHYGRGQVYNDTPRINSIDIVKQSDGSLELIGYNGVSDEPKAKGQHGHNNPNIFRKGDGQVSKTYSNAEDRIMNLGVEVRKLYPDASIVFLTQAMIAIRRYAAEHKISSNRVVSLIKRERLKLDDEDFKVKPTNENKNRKTIMITEMVAKQFSEMMEMTEYKFHNCIKKYLHDLLVDPVNAQVPEILKYRGFNRGKLVALLKNNDLLRKQEKIVDKDENGKYRTATMQVKYLVPKKNFERKLRNLYIKMFERNLPPRTYMVSEEGAAGGGSLGGATSADASGQFSQPLFPMQRRKMYDVSEDTTTNSVGDYQYDVPFIGDKETLSRQNGQGGSTSINIDEATMNENDNHKYYDYLEDYDTYEVLMMFMDKSNPWMPLINPDMYKRACEEFVKYGEFQRFPTKYIYQWMGIIMKNTAILRELTVLSGHDSYFPEDEFRDFFFGDEDRNEQGQSWEEWCEECGKSDFSAAYAYLESLGFDEWAKLPDGSDAISDYGIQPIEKLIAEYDENMSPEKCLVLVNKILDVVHYRGDLASAFITGGSKSCQDITYRQNESVTKSINLINEYLDKNMRRVRQGIEKGRDEFGKWAEKPYGEDKREVIHNEWMIHFSNDESLKNIAKQGFTQGNRYDKEPEQVTYGKHKYEGGFNYAYLASDVIESFGATTEVELHDLRSSFMYVLSQEKLNGFMMFKGNGYRFFHSGDAENQVVFNSIQPDTKVMIIYLDGFYCVMRNTDIKYDYRTEKPFKKSENGGRVKTIEDNPRNQMNDIIYFSRNIEKVIEWVETNFEQYRRQFKYNINF